MESVINRMLLMSGKPLPLSRSVCIQHPTVDDVLSLNDGYNCEDYYWTYTMAILSDPYDYMVYLDDKDIDYEDVTPFRVFCERWLDAKAMFAKDNDSTALALMHSALQFYFGAHYFDVVLHDGELYLVDTNDPQWVLSCDMFDVASEFITKINFLDKKDRIKPATPGAKRVLIEDAREEIKKRARKKKQDDAPDHIGEALAVVFAGGAGSITPDNLSRVHIYQLLSTSRAVQKQMVVQSLLNGIYCGMLKADKISDQELRWV